MLSPNVSICRRLTIDIGFRWINLSFRCGCLYSRRFTVAIWFIVSIRTIWYAVALFLNRNTLTIPTCEFFIRARCAYSFVCSCFYEIVGVSVCVWVGGRWAYSFELGIFLEIFQTTYIFKCRIHNKKLLKLIKWKYFVSKLNDKKTIGSS